MSMKILLVDDDTFLLDMYAMKFGASGHEIETVKSVEAALDKLRGKEVVYDAILLDMILPGMTGMDMLKTLKDEKLGGGAKVIVLSNQGDDGDIVEATKMGADGYMVKAHMIPSEVVQKVEEIVGRK